MKADHLKLTLRYRACSPRSTSTEDDMNAAIELAFVIAGLFALCWAIMSPSAHPAARVGAGTFGILALIVAAILQSEDAERRRDC